MRLHTAMATAAAAMRRQINRTATACLLLALTACGGGSGKTPPLQLSKPAEESRTASLHLRWQVNVGNMSPLLQPALNADGSRVCTISRSGQVQMRATADGSETRAAFNLHTAEEISAAAGCDGDIAAAVSADGTLHVHHATRGELWTLPLHTRAYAAPLLASGRLFVLGLDGRLRALTQRKGRELWRYDSPREKTLRTPLESSPVLAGKVLYVGVNSGVLIALTPSNGRVLWENAVSLPGGNNAIANILDVTTPAVSRTRVCATAYQGGVACFARGDGTRLWHTPLSAQVRATFDESGDRLFVSESSGVLHAFHADNGKVLWRTPTARQLSAPLASKEVVLVGDDSGRVHAFFADNGNYATAVQIGGGKVLHLQQLPDGDVLVLSQGGRLTRLQVSR